MMINDKNDYYYNDDDANDAFAISSSLTMSPHFSMLSSILCARMARGGNTNDCGLKYGFATYVKKPISDLPDDNDHGNI